MTTTILRRFEDVNRELWLILSLFVIAAIVNFAVSGQRMMLSFYTLPTIFSAYHYGRRHATLTALASVLLVVLLLHFSPSALGTATAAASLEGWLEITVWGGVLVVTGYAMGLLCEKKDEQVREVREAYQGILMILRQFIANDKYTENHSYRVSVYATEVAAHMHLGDQQIEDIRAAALLHDIGKLDISRHVLHKASKLTAEETTEMRQHVVKGAAILEPVAGALPRVLQIILAHHDKFDGTGYSASQGDEIPLEARIIAVADVYDSLTSDRPYRKAMRLSEAHQVIVDGAGKEFDPAVVEAFCSAFRRGEMEVPAIVV